MATPTNTIDSIVTDNKKILLHSGNNPVAGYLNFDRRPKFAQQIATNYQFSPDGYFFAQEEIGSLDVIRILPGTLEEVTVDHAEKLVNRWYDLLKPNGLLMIEAFDIRVFANCFVYGNISLASFREAITDKFKSLHTNMSLLEMCVKFGFNLQSMYYDNEIVKINFIKP